MHVAARRIQHAAAIGVGIHQLAERVAVEKLMIVHAVLAPERLLGFQFLHVRRGVGRIDVARLQIAVDLILADEPADDLAALLHQPADEAGCVLAVAALDGRKAGVETVDDLAAIAPDAPQPTCAPSTTTTL